MEGEAEIKSRWDTINQKSKDIANSDGKTLTWIAVDKVNLDVLNLLNEWDALELDTADVDGNTPGKLAAQYEDPEVVRYVHSLGGNLAIPNDWGQISTHDAAACDNTEVLKFLHQVGVDLRYKDHFRKYRTARWIRI